MLPVSTGKVEEASFFPDYLTNFINSTEGTIHNRGNGKTHNCDTQLACVPERCASSYFGSKPFVHLSWFENGICKFLGGTKFWVVQIFLLPLKIRTIFYSGYIVRRVLYEPQIV